MHQCFADKCKRLGKRHCKDGYPWAVHQSKTPEWDDKRGAYKYFRPEAEDARVIPYNPLLLLTWKARANVQIVTGRAWRRYLLKCVDCIWMAL
jgi:hypothetical protein